MIRIPASIAWLTLVWLVLWGDFSPANALSGVAVATAVTVLFPGRRARRWGSRFSPFGIVAFAVYFHWKLLEANVVLAWEILSPRDTMQAGIIALPVEEASDLVVTLIANAISLTPGTLTLEVRRNPTILYVHVLHLHDAERIRRDVRQFEQFARRALGGRGAARPAARDAEGA